MKAKCSKCGKELEFIPLYKKYLEEYLGVTVEEAVRQGLKFVCPKCDERRVK